MNAPARGRSLYARFSVPLRLLRLTIGSLPPFACNWLWEQIKGSRSLPSRALREAILQAQARSCGELVDVKNYVEILGRRNIDIGSRVSIHPFCYIDATGGLSIGDDVSVAHAVTIMTTEHRFDDLDLPIRDQGVSSGRVVIDNDVWIGAGARVLAGVTVGRGSVVAAGAVVTRDVLPFTVVAGVPARLVRER